jgi:site-specific DNA recombinase
VQNRDPDTPDGARRALLARYIPARALEGLVWRDLCDVLTTPEIVTRAMEWAREGHWLPQELQAGQASLRRGQATLSPQLERLTKAYLAAVLTTEEYERRRHDMECRLLALNAQERAH